jgi:hypothetical protein
MDNIYWCWFSGNSNAIHILEKNLTKVDWYVLSQNPSIFELDYHGLKNRCNIFKEELIQVALKPSKIQKYLDLGYELDDLDNYI